MESNTRSSPRPEPDSPPRVLVIEDSDDVRYAVRRALKRGRMEVLEARTGEEGLAKARDHAPDVILCDVSMPGLDGFEVLERLRTDPTTASTPIILVTGLADRASIRKGMLLGADDYLTKPFSAREVCDAVTARITRLSRISKGYESKLAETQAELLKARHLDVESGLQNRAGFREDLKRTDASEPLAVLIVELDRFERIRSALHASQPELITNVIRETGRRLASVAGDPGLVYRLDSSRFAVLLPGTARAAAASEVAEAALGTLHLPIGTDLEIRLTGSIGLAHQSHSGGTTPLALANHAEGAAHSAREAGGNHVVVYDPTTQDRAYNRMVLESSMHRALERNQFELHYQPQVSADTGELTGFEALIRWNHPELGQVSPFHFIPIAEETGLIVPIGRWVIEEACRQLVAFGDGIPPVRVSVNLSALQLAEPTFAATVLSILARTGLPADQLCVELTESMMIQAGDDAARSLRILRDAGVAVSIDDFGTGYSSLTNLRSFPVTEVKIDRSFMRRIPDDHDNCSIVAAVIEMAHQLGLTVIAEGVEDAPQLEFLRTRRCDQIQGYYFSRPLPAPAFLEWASGRAKAA